MSIAMSRIEDKLQDILIKATGEAVPTGHTITEKPYWYHGFASHGYRNTDVVNSMIAFAVCRPEIPCFTQKECEEFVDSYMIWVMQHVAEEDWDDVRAKAEVVVDYIDKYRKDPESYVISCMYI